MISNIHMKRTIATQSLDDGDFVVAVWNDASSDILPGGTVQLTNGGGETHTITFSRISVGITSAKNTHFSSGLPVTHVDHFAFADDPSNPSDDSGTIAEGQTLLELRLSDAAAPDTRAPATIDSLLAAPSTSGWIIYSPEERARLGDVYESSEVAVRLCQQHNQATGHHSVVQPYLDFAPAAASTRAGALAIRPLDLQIFPWPFCIYYDGRPQENRDIYAATESQAAAIMAALVFKVNQESVRRRIPPLWSASGGNCPAQ